MRPTFQLLAYRFGPDAAFEGRLVGALERMESGGTLKIVDVLFVGRDAESGALVAVDARSEHSGGFVGSLLGFRLDPATRGRLTEHAVRAYGGEGGSALRGIGEKLAPGEAVAVVLVEHLWARALNEALAQTHGSALVDEFVTATALTELMATLDAAVDGDARSAPPA